MRFFILVALSALASSVRASTSKCYCVDYSTYSGNYCVNSKTAAASAYYFQHYVETGEATMGSGGTSGMTFSYVLSNSVSSRFIKSPVLGGCTYVPVSNVGYFRTACKARSAVTADCL
ncbi:hypothetical protein K450DRAFT_194890 [Umbelopsis ramanniana AG]|uniref:Uncharacterized protein n=1 Tax=Umbelopsis ramanniana AG TaxID=1314678 RepID=A0AAD5EJ03_UMBRA|nr:uncharacterized protein K450DRAFT_194890 [Umbelopsis ramanniana AG]KAI8584439.1 hypothetical protein K450DRAFT_194890 [Umbelopsis ramanniana AG]